MKSRLLLALSGALIRVAGRCKSVEFWFGAAAVGAAKFAYRVRSRVDPDYLEKLDMERLRLIREAAP